MLEKLFENLPDAFMTIRIVDSEGKDTKGIDRKLVTNDPRSGNAVVTLPIELGFDLAVWRTNVRPAIEQVLTAVAESKQESAFTANRREQLDGGVSVYDWTPAIDPNNPQRPLVNVLLLRENLGRGRQLVFDRYIIDSRLLPLVVESSGSLRHRDWTRTLRIRLRDADGEVVDGVELRFRAGDRTLRFGNYEFSPFSWFGGRGVLIAPALVITNFQDVSAPAFTLRPTLTMPIADIDPIASISVELVK